MGYEELSKQLNEQEDVNALQQVQIYGLQDELDAVYRREAVLRKQLRATEARVQILRRAHNRHVLDVMPKYQAPGWARRRAQDARTWAKPKGWRL